MHVSHGNHLLSCWATFLSDNWSATMHWQKSKHKLFSRSIKVHASMFAHQTWHTSLVQFTTALLLQSAFVSCCHLVCKLRVNQSHVVALGTTKQNRLQQLLILIQYFQSNWNMIKSLNYWGLVSNEVVEWLLVTSLLTNPQYNMTWSWLILVWSLDFTVTPVEY